MNYETARPSDSAAFSGKRHRVLVVEDNPDDAALTRRAILRATPGVEIDLAQDGKEAVDRLLPVDRNNPTYPSLVFLDLKLPRMDGLEVLRSVRQDPSNCLLPIVMLTSSDLPNDLLGCYREGVNSYIKKPVDFDQFMSDVGSATQYWLLINLRPPTP